MSKKKNVRLSNDADTSHVNRSSIAVWPQESRRKKKKKKSKKKKVSKDKKQHERSASGS